MAIQTSGGGLAVGVMQPVTADLARQSADDRPKQRPSAGSVSEGSPTAELAPGSLTFAAHFGKANPSPQAIIITNVGVGRLLFSTTTDTAYIMASPKQGRAPGSIIITALVAGLAVGVHTAHITVAIAGGTVPSISVPVTVTISA